MDNNSATDKGGLGILKKHLRKLFGSNEEMDNSMCNKYEEICAAMEEYASQFPAQREDQKGFLEYADSARAKFVNDFWGLFPEGNQRVIAENLIICFDQMKERLSTAQRTCVWVGEFLSDLSKMITDESGYDVPFKEIPESYQKDFKSWTQEYKQQDWEEENWGKAWYNYQREYLKFIIGNKIESSCGASMRRKGRLHL